MKGNRDKKQGEVLPQFENEFLTGLNPKVQVRFNFDEVPESDDRKASYNYEYVNVPDLKRETIISAIIREKYSQDHVEALLSNSAKKKDIIDFLRFQNYREYAKAVADQDLNRMQAAKDTIVLRVSLPLDTTLEGGDYETLATRMIKVSVPYEVDQLNNIAYAYPAWISVDDLAILEADPRISIETLSLYEGI